MMASYTYSAKGIMKTEEFTYLPLEWGTCLSAHMVEWIDMPDPRLLHSGTPEEQQRNTNIKYKQHQEKKENPVHLQWGNTASSCRHSN